MQNNHRDNQYQSSGHTGRKAFHIAGHVMVGLAFAIVFALVFAFLVKFIWNSIMPAIFGLTTITFWQAFGIVVLAKLIFGGFGHHAHDRWRKDRSDYWHKKWHQTEDEIPPPRKFSRDWKYYKQYWQDEGKAAFETYMNRIGNEKESQ